MSFYQDKQVKAYCFFLLVFAFLILMTGMIFSKNLIHAAKGMYLCHDKAIAASLLEQGIPKETVAIALTNTDISEEGEALLDLIGIGEQTDTSAVPFFCRFQQNLICSILLVIVFLIFLLFTGTFLFFRQREKLYLQAEKIVKNYLDGDFSCHLPQNKEGMVFQIFSSVEQLATMLQSKKETEHTAKEFLKRTISDISHQLKTPLAALSMYQEIVEDEPDNTETVKEFSAKIGTALKRMEQLIQSMLKITRLDAGNIVFDKSCYTVAELLDHSLSELTTRAKNENKKIIANGDYEQTLVCDIDWTSEAIGNIVKNALDHTDTGGAIRISWERTAAMVRIIISDTGKGIAPEDIYHIFKRFYRSQHSLDKPGIGLGLPLAKSIIEGQGGFISVQSEENEGSVFTISFLTES